MLPYLKDAIRYAVTRHSPLGNGHAGADAEVHRRTRPQNEENRKQREAYEKELAEYERKYGKPKKKAR